jgi:hypothetical protein
MAKAKNIDLNKLDTAARKRVERVIAPRDKRLALLFVKGDVERWERAARKEARAGACENLSNWIELYLDAAAAEDPPLVSRGAVESAMVARDYPLNRRFNGAKLRKWKAVARCRGMSLTLWVESVLNIAALVVRK